MMRPNYNKSTGQSYSAAEWGQLKSKCNAPGLNDSFSSVVSFDDEYYPDLYVMSGSLTYTIDSTNAGTGNKRDDIIVGDGNTITFTGFTIRKSDLTVTTNSVTTVNNKIYKIEFLRRGAISEVYLTDTGFTYASGDTLNTPTLTAIEFNSTSIILQISNYDVLTESFVLESSPNGTDTWTSVSNYDGVSTDGIYDTGLSAAQTVYYRAKSTANGYTDSDYATANATTASTFTPTDIASIDLWLDVDQGIFTDTAGTTPATSEDDVIRRIEDQSGNNNHFTGTNGPLLKNNIFNSSDGLLFDGVDDILQGTSQLTSTGAGHIFVLLRPTTYDWPIDISSATPQYILSEASNASNDPTFGLAWANGTVSTATYPNLQVKEGATFHNLIQYQDQDKLYSPEFMLLHFYSDGASYGLKVTGSEVEKVFDLGSDDGKWISDITTTLNTIALGGIVKSTISGYFAGYIKELIVYNAALNTTQVNQVEQYMMAEVGTLARMPKPRFGQNREANFNNNKIYITHGMRKDQSFFADLFEYDLSTNKWTQKTSGTHGRDGVAVEVYDNKLFVFGGRDLGNASSPVGRNFLEIYDISGDSWSDGTDLPIPAADPGSEYYNDGDTNKMFVFGGYGTLGPTDRLSDVQLYYPDTDTWATSGDIPTSMTYEKAAPMAIRREGRIYVWGGTGGAGITEKAEYYDISADTWTAISDLPANLTPSSGFGMVGCYDANTDKFYLGNGDENYFYSYDPNTDIYTALAGLPFDRKYMCMTVLNGIIYSFAGGEGSGDGASSLTARYNIAGDTWTI